jgi:hypothetical protein
MHPGDLEDVVDRALKRLPEPRAPHTLLPRVMAAVEDERAARLAGSSRRTGARPWLSWPLASQVASLAVLVVLAMGIARLWPQAQDVFQQSAPPVLADVATSVGKIASTATTVASVTRIVWNALVQPLVAYVLVLVLVMCAACVTFGAALGRVVLGGVPQT